MRGFHIRIVVERREHLLGPFSRYLRYPLLYRAHVFWSLCISHVSQQQFTLRAAIAGDDAKLASGGWSIFPEWDSNLPTEFCRELSAFQLPLHLCFACRDLFPPVQFLLPQPGLDCAWPGRIFCEREPDWQ
jgi:hypothetical protein